MTFERLKRIGHDGGPLWTMRLNKNGYGERGRNRALVFEPTQSRNPSRGAELYFWMEEDRPRLYWRVDYDREMARPPATTTPEFVVDRVEVNNSRRVLGSASPYEYICVRALATSELLGESATSAVYSIFWQNFVENDGGLHYLHRFADRETANYYARQRLLRYIGHDGPQAHYVARSLVEDSMTHDHALAERFSMRLVRDRNLVAAIEAIGMTNDDKDTQHTNVRRIVELNASRMDHVITRVVDTTRDKQALLGLRACQRIEADATFFAACDAYVLAHPDGKGLSKMLRPHCPTPKTHWPPDSSRYDTDETEADLDDPSDDEESQDAA